MIINVTLTDSTGLQESVYEAVAESLQESLAGTEDHEYNQRLEQEVEAQMERLNLWFEDSEMLTIEFDTRKLAARILTRREREELYG